MNITFKAKAVVATITDEGGAEIMTYEVENYSLHLDLLTLVRSSATLGEAVAKMKQACIAAAFVS